MKLKSEYIHSAPEAHVIVIFEGSPHMRDTVIRKFEQWNKASVYGTLSEEGGLRKLNELEKVDLIVIGGRYNKEQRKSIKKAVRRLHTITQTSEPGIDYPYDHGELLKDVEQKIINPP